MYSAQPGRPLCSLSKFSFPCSETCISQHPQPRLTQSCYISYYEIKSHPKGLSSSSYHQTCELHSSDVIPDFSQLPSFRWFLLSCVISPPHSGIIPAGIQTHTLCKRKSSFPDSLSVAAACSLFPCSKTAIAPSLLPILPFVLLSFSAASKLHQCSYPDTSKLQVGRFSSSYSTLLTVLDPVDSASLLATSALELPLLFSFPPSSVSSWPLLITLLSCFCSYSCLQISGSHSEAVSEGHLAMGRETQWEGSQLAAEWVLLASS